MKLNIAEAIVEKTKLNYARLIEKAKINKEQAKKDWKKHQE